VVLDAVARLAPPGTVMVLSGEQALAVNAVTTGTAHEGGAAALLAIASLTGDLPGRVVVVGVVPEIVRTGIGLSPAVERALAAAIGVARGEISRLAADSPAPRAPEPAAAG
jgi:hydrogenase maturation protease